MPRIAAHPVRAHRSILELEDEQEELLRRLDELNRRIEATLAAVEREGQRKPPGQAPTAAAA